MTYMSYQPVEMSVADFRSRLADAINLTTHGQTVYVTSRGRRVAALVDLRTAEGADGHAPSAAELWPLINKLSHIVATCSDAPCINCRASTVKCPTWDNPEWREALAALEAVAQRMPS